MGALTTMIGFGAGYVVGTRRNGNPAAQLRGTIQGALGNFTKGPGRGVTDVRQVREIMTALPDTVEPDATLVEAAKRMADGDIGDVLVVEPGGERLVGILTDRDMVVRAVAAGSDPLTTTVGSVLSEHLETLAPTDTVQEAAVRMRAADVRRLPVVEGRLLIGIVSLGDLALATDSGSTLADISVASPDR